MCLGHHSGRTPAEVVGKLRDVQQAAWTGRIVEPSKVTVGEFLTKWLSGWQTVRLNLAASTFASYSDLMRCNSSPALGTLKLQRLGPFHLAKLYADCGKKELSPRWVQMVHRVLH